MDTITQNHPTDFIEIIVNSFEDRILKIEASFSTSEVINHSSSDLLKDFQQSIQKFRNERSQLNSLLRHNLAKNGSIRKCDYNCLMNEIFTYINEKEHEAEYQFNRYNEDQKQMVLFLRQEIVEINSVEQDNYNVKIADFKTKFDTILKSHHQRKEGAITKINEFRHIHQKITSKFKQLLEQDVLLFCKDIKNLKKQLLDELG